MGVQIGLKKDDIGFQQQKVSRMTEFLAIVRAAAAKQIS